MTEGWVAKIEWVKDDPSLDEFVCTEIKKFKTYIEGLLHLVKRLSYDVAEEYYWMKKTKEWKSAKKHLGGCRNIYDLNAWLYMYFRGTHVFTRARVSLFKKIDVHHIEELKQGILCEEGDEKWITFQNAGLYSLD